MAAVRTVSFIVLVFGCWIITAGVVDSSGRIGRDRWSNECQRSVLGVLWYAAVSVVVMNKEEIRLGTGTGYLRLQYCFDFG
jgi:hypothetical protein